MDEIIITENYLKSNPSHIFVFGDNLQRWGKGGAAKLRYLPNTFGFVTKKAPTYNDLDFYRPAEYFKVFEQELNKLNNIIVSKPNNTFLISKIGAGLANRYQIFEQVIEPGLIEWQKKYEHKNIKFLWGINSND